MEENQQVMKKLSLLTNTFSDLISTFNMKNKNASKTKLEQVLNKIGSDIKLYKRDNILSKVSPKVKLE